MADEKVTEEKGVENAAPAQETPKPTYDPSKKYNWKQNDVFYVSGSEFGVLLNATRAILSTREAQTILLAERASEIIETAMARAVEAGIAKPMEEK